MGGTIPFLIAFATVFVAYKTKKVDVQTSGKFLLQLDGEVVGEAPASFSIIPSALRVITGGFHG